ncbi:hypothetical protein TIFTF001_010538 [Ficus carica]|uniref:Uncharacterized protein n=1 Tax=Ficus carica TaxID=3494 RepID=A0AA88AJK4_FICCA|nr:hypothetical protein TIFTF001_010538 [Ficus carica]
MDPTLGHQELEGTKSGAKKQRDERSSTLNAILNSGTELIFFLLGGMKREKQTAASGLGLSVQKNLVMCFIEFDMGTQIPSSISTLRQLRYLNLSYTFMGGNIPPQVANLSNLRVLDLSNNHYTIKSLKWVSHLSSLIDLRLSGIDLGQAYDWLQMVNQLPSLKNLQLSYCMLREVMIMTPSHSVVNSSTSLSILNLSNNNFSVPIYSWLFNLSNSLVHLDLSVNQFEGCVPELFGTMTALTYLDLSRNVNLNGSIPKSFSQMTALTYLDLSHNKLKGAIFPEILGNMSALVYLDLGDNMLEGEIPKSIWNARLLRTLRLDSNNLSGHLPQSSFHQLKQLEVLDISRNSLRGVISEAGFSELSELYYLDLSFNSLALNIDSEWIPPFRLRYIYLGSCKLGPQFPKWLRTQNNYFFLDISNSGISDSVPNWFWNLSTAFQSMNLSNNQITGEIGNISLDFQVESTYDNLDIDLSSNQLEELKVLILTKNKLSAKIPTSIGSLTQIEALRLTDNNFIGELPTTLKNCTWLSVIDFGGNKLSRPIPTSIGENSRGLIILSLRSNFFYGSIPSSLCHLAYLQLLDLSGNDITGSIPKCISNFTAMREGWRDERTTITHIYATHKSSEGMFITEEYEDDVQLQWKGNLMEFRSILRLVKSIDLSCNKLLGKIPVEIVELDGLVSLNLSRNNLGGQIPQEIGQLKSLDVLDLSRNNLHGRIPSSLTQIDRLNTLDLSNNKLSGEIPTGTQLQSFPSTSYIGNAELCGAPLSTKCPSDQEQIVFGATTQEADELLTQGFYISMALGFVVAFWGVCGTLIFNKSFRYSYFKLLNDFGDFLWIMTAIHKAKLLRMIKC